MLFRKGKHSWVVTILDYITEICGAESGTYLCHFLCLFSEMLLTYQWLVIQIMCTEKQKYLHCFLDNSHCYVRTTAQLQKCHKLSLLQPHFLLFKSFIGYITWTRAASTWWGFFRPYSSPLWTLRHVLWCWSFHTQVSAFVLAVFQNFPFPHVLCETYRQPYYKWCCFYSGAKSCSPGQFANVKNHFGHREHLGGIWEAHCMHNTKSLLFKHSGFLMYG